MTPPARRLAAVLLAAACLAADAPPEPTKPIRLTVEPAEVVLRGPFGRVQLVVTG